MSTSESDLPPARSGPSHPNAASHSMLFTDIPKYEELDQESKAIYHHDKEKYERIARKHGKSLLYAKAGLQEETWVPLIEKAYAKYYGNYSHLEAGWTREAIEDLTGYVVRRDSRCFEL